MFVSVAALAGEAVNAKKRAATPAGGIAVPSREVC
jgi:hypothetical protein